MAVEPGDVRGRAWWRWSRVTSEAGRQDARPDGSGLGVRRRAMSGGPGACRGLGEERRPASRTRNSSSLSEARLCTGKASSECFNARRLMHELNGVAGAPRAAVPACPSPSRPLDVPHVHQWPHTTLNVRIYSIVAFVR